MNTIPCGDGFQIHKQEERIMCIICVSPARTRQPSISQIRTMFRNNPHGAVYMFSRDGRVQIHKGFMDVASFLDAIRG